MVLASAVNIIEVWDKDKYEKAIPIIKDIVERRSEALGAGHVDTLNSKNTLAFCHVKRREYKEAISIFEDILKQRIKSLGPDHRDTENCKQNLEFCRKQMAK